MRVRALLTSRTTGRTAGVLLASVSIAFAGVAVASPANAHSTPTLQRGDKGACVAYVQKKMGVRVDGDFGPETQRGVMNFERRHGLAVNGVVSQSVWNRIGPCPQGAATPTPPALPTSSCAYRLPRTDADVRAVACEIGRKFNVKTVYGFANTGSTKCDSHQNGRALDFMVYKDKAKGDAIAKYAQANAARLKISYMIWYQRSWNPQRGTWVRMRDRGNVTLNHIDHPHISFKC